MFGGKQDTKPLYLMGRAVGWEHESEVCSWRHSLGLRAQQQQGCAACWWKSMWMQWSVAMDASVTCGAEYSFKPEILAPCV